MKNYSYFGSGYLFMITIAQEKIRLLRAMDEMSAGGMKSEGMRPKREVLYHCDIEEE